MAAMAMMVVGSTVSALAWLSIPRSPTMQAREAPPRGPWAPQPPGRQLLVATSLAAAIIGWRAGISAAIAALGLFAGLSTAWALVIRARQRTARRRRQSAVIEFCDALAAEFQAGLPAGRALDHACEVWHEWRPVAAAAALGAEVAPVLRTAAGQSGAEGLRAVAAAWDVAGHTGAGLAAVLDTIGGALRHDQEARAEVAAALGPTRATARLLAVLPIFGIAMGTSMGAEPIGFLAQTDVGRTCLVAGVLLALGGLWWVERLAQSAEA
jgi:tight adherence protein B